MTPARATLVLAVALVAAAVAFDAAPLYVPGIGLLLAYAVAGAWVRIAARGAQLTHETGRLTIVEGERYPLDVVVRAGSLPLPGGAVAHPLVDSPVDLGHRTVARVRLEVPAPRRGWHEIGSVSLSVTDPLRLATREVGTDASNRVLVLPRVEPVVIPDGGLGGTGESIPMGAGTPRGSGPGRRGVAFEMDGLRSHRPGSPASRIHWPILARTGELVERRLVGGTNASPVVALDAERPSDPEALDRAVRASASLCVHLAPATGCVLLLPGERLPHRIDPGLQLWPRAHARLAVVEGGDRPPAIRSVARGATVFWVSATAEPARTEPAFAGSPGYLVTPSALADREPAFTVAGCHGYRMGVATRRPQSGRRAA